MRHGASPNETRQYPADRLFQEARPQSSVQEVALAGEDHGHPELVGLGDVLVVAHRCRRAAR